MRSSGVGDAMVWAFVNVCFVTLVGVDAMFFRMLRGLKSAERRGGDTNRLTESAPRQIGEARRDAPGDAAPSITEHTTRTFEPAFRERRVE